MFRQEGLAFASMLSRPESLRFSFVENAILVGVGLRMFRQEGLAFASMLSRPESLRFSFVENAILVGVGLRMFRQEGLAFASMLSRPESLRFSFVENAILVGVGLWMFRQYLLTFIQGGQPPKLVSLANGYPSVLIGVGLGESFQQVHEFRKVLRIHDFLISPFFFLIAGVFIFSHLNRLNLLAAVISVTLTCDRPWGEKAENSDDAGQGRDSHLHGSSVFLRCRYQDLWNSNGDARSDDTSLRQLTRTIDFPSSFRARR